MSHPPHECPTCGRSENQWGIDWPRAFHEEQVRRINAEKLIAEHNAGCIAACDYQGRCSPYVTRGMRCGSCTRDWLIETQ